MDSNQKRHGIYGESMNKQGNLLSVFLIYIREKRKGWMLLLVSCLVFVFVFYLYGLPIRNIVYALLLLLFGGGIGLAYDFYRYYETYLLLLRCRYAIAYDLPVFPEPRNKIEQGYQEIIEIYYTEHLRVMSNQARLKQEQVDYYTMWTHQIKTPISAMKLLLQSEIKQENQLLLAELFKIEQYTEMALQYLRMDMDTTDFVFQQLCLSDLVKQAVRKYSVLFVQKKIRLVFTETEDKVLTDQKWAVFMIEQIISNTIKYTAAGGTVHIEARKDKEQILLVISDTGIGIQAEDLPRVFDKGFTGYNGRMDKKSTGIGLYLCKKISDKLEHTLSIESEPSKGTQVVLGFYDQPRGIEMKD